MNIRGEQPQAGATIVQLGGGRRNVLPRYQGVSSRFVATMGGESRRLFLRGVLSRREQVSVAINEPLSNHRDSALR
jgi:hypothetical protein